jgi:hypothetical protein
VNGNAYVGGSVTATGATFTTGAGSGKVWTSDGSGVGSWAALGGAAYKGQIDGSTGSGLADGTGTTGWYYACSTAGSHNYGSGSITLAIGDQLYYNGSIWLKIPGAGSYTLPTADASTLGGVKIGTGIGISSGTISVSTAYRSDSWLPPNDHVAVTIGTANGLSLSTQALSLATASGSTTGALNSTDWTTFNGKQAAGSYVTTATTVNGHALSGNISVTPTDLGLVIGTNVLAYRTFGTAANSATGDFVAYRTFGSAANSATTDFVAARSFGTAANSATGDFEVPLTFSTGLTRTGNTITNTITQYTDALARGAVSFTAGSGAYNSTTGVFTIPTNTNQLTNGAGFITGYTETDPTIYSWAKASTKPSYSYSEVGAQPVENQRLSTTNTPTFSYINLTYGAGSGRVLTSDAGGYAYWNTINYSEKGTYTATITDIGGYATTANVTKVDYTTIGNSVHVRLSGTFASTGAGTCWITVSLPFSTTFSGDPLIVGTGVVNEDTAINFVSGLVEHISGTEAKFYFNTTVAGSDIFCIQFDYNY